MHFFFVLDCMTTNIQPTLSFLPILPILFIFYIYKFYYLMCCFIPFCFRFLFYFLIFINCKYYRWIFNYFLTAYIQIKLLSNSYINIFSPVQGKTRVIRTCGYIQDKHDDKNCFRRTGTKDVEIFYCSCTRSLCNDGNTVKRPARIVIALFTILVVKQLIGGLSA